MGVQNGMLKENEKQANILAAKVMRITFFHIYVDLYS